MGLISNATLVQLGNIAKLLGKILDELVSIANLLHQILVEMKKQTEPLDYIAEAESFRLTGKRRTP